MQKFQLILYYDLVDLGIVVEEDVVAIYFLGAFSNHLMMPFLWS